MMMPIEISVASPHLGTPYGLVHENRSIEARPLDTLSLLGAEGCKVAVRDGHGQVYWSGLGGEKTSFVVGGALGDQRIEVSAPNTTSVTALSFHVQASTEIDDEHGEFKDLLEMLHRSMMVYGGVGVQEYAGKAYRFYVPWNLDQCMTAKGMRYFDGSTHEFVDLHRLGQRRDGMIYSNTAFDDGPGYFDTAYGHLGLVKHEGGLRWTRQAVEAMPEFFYVLNMYGAWMDNGDLAWLKETVDSGCRALDYVMADTRLRWSKKYDLIKRACTIDMWDFQASDKYLVDWVVSPSMVIDPERTKFGIFYGDNTGYAYACRCLAQMLDSAGRHTDAESYRLRGEQILDRTNRLLWNGQFYTQRVEEDSTVVRDFGVDEKSQVTLSNALSVNREIGHEKGVQIIRTYQRIRQEMPKGSPGEWYMCYPPYLKGFDMHDGLWEYMNGGVSATVAGELAKGAFENGFETYGSDILRRIHDLGKSHNNRIGWAWRGAPFPPYQPAAYQTIDLASLANMDIADRASEKAAGCFDNNASVGNDLQAMPTGDRTYAGVPYHIADPTTNERRCGVGVAAQGRLPRKVEIPIGMTAKTLYLLQGLSKTGSSQLGAYVKMLYTDGTQSTVYEKAGQEMAGYWFPQLKTPTAGVAWSGPNARSSAVGVTWAALANPKPDQPIRAIEYGAVEDGAIAALFGLTLSNQPHPVPRSDDSYGGPENWPPASCTYALLEGLAGTAPATAGFESADVSPRWASCAVDNVTCRTVLPASNGYVAYRYAHDPRKKTITLSVTGSGKQIHLHLLLPSEVGSKRSVTVDGKPHQFKESFIETSRYLDLDLGGRPSLVEVKW
jgi:hypothetical protein